MHGPSSLVSLAINRNCIAANVATMLNGIHFVRVSCGESLEESSGATTAKLSDGWTASCTACAVSSSAFSCVALDNGTRSGE